MIKQLSLLFCLLSLTSTTWAKSLFAQSTQNTPLLELYTSEGCSSCPPADRWFSELKSHPDLWTKFVPIAFHVPYWDYIGHKDRFADERANQRQRNHAKRLNSRNVYTPEMFLAGDEWRTWRFIDPVKVNSLEKNTELTIWKNKDGSYSAESNQKNVTIHIAQLVFGESTSPKLGENAGKKLEHDFVIKQWKQDSLKPEDANKSAIVAWVEDKNGKPLQATGAWLN